MFRWFRRHASARLKLGIAFGTLNSMLVVVVGVSAGEYLRNSLVTNGPSFDLMRQALAESGTTSLACAAAVLVACLFVGAVASRTVTGPIEDAVARLEGLACGDLDTPIDFAEADADDETGRMARAMLALQASAKASGRVQEDLADQRRQNAILVDCFFSIRDPRRDGPAPTAAPGSQSPRSEPRLVVDNPACASAAAESAREDALLGLLALFGRAQRH